MRASERTSITDAFVLHRIVDEDEDEDEDDNGCDCHCKCEA